MKFRKFVYQTMMMGLFPFATLIGEEMKLINSSTGYVVVEFKDGKAHFNDRFLKSEMEESGILIPPAHAKDFAGKELIFPDDPLFQKAFMEVYYPLYIADPLYQWQKD